MSDENKAIVPFADISKMAAVMGKNKMFGKSAEELLPLMLIAQAEHKHPAIAAMEYDIIQGRPAINSKASLARFQAAGGRIQWDKRTDTEATATFAHPAGGTLTVTWTMERAKKAGLADKPTWKAYPAQMLSARVISEGVRAVYPACLSGMYTNEEVQDMEPVQMRNVTPEKAEAKAEPNLLDPANYPDVGYEPDPAPASAAPSTTTLRKRIGRLVMDPANGFSREGQEAARAFCDAHAEDDDAMRAELERLTQLSAGARERAKLDAEADVGFNQASGK